MGFARWDAGEMPPATDVSWAQLSGEQLSAARLMGFDETEWDCDSDSDSD
jgi:hypothetical protein